MIRLAFISCLLFQCAFAQSKKPVNDRTTWLVKMDKICRPVMSALANDQLKATMPVELSKRVDNAENRSKVAHLEAFGRTLSGIGPWLNLEGGSKEEVSLRNEYRQWALKAIANSVNPSAKDYLKWTGGQPLVDASFVALGLVRCPWLWQNLDTTAKRQLVEAFKSTRPTVPVYSNWLLFSAMIEAFFCKYGLDYDPVRIDYAVREFSEHWYVGDGLFSDGMEFHLDYYNSIVIHPYLVAVVEIANSKYRAYQGFLPKLSLINKRFGEIQERMINADGSYPIIGRSIAYRGGVFHHLSDLALRKQLPTSISPAQVRGALTAVITKTLEAPTVFSSTGWLKIGVYGSQPDLAESYINTGSLYICNTIFAALGLPDTDEFWSAPAAPWTAVKVWTGKDAPADHAADIR
ncbi:DUF2264 domain-containing protein [Segetibacter sp. 3557_3]|uniref:DUF2264 domain-containing protein n=1 Tax=Segetibacter sp. 3557_3 TaxID=2547429 RepID=UPI001058E9DC|nr:DUF2264 domain-containing protein [Segetibacter sp. 3557_3]TDH21297.1 DUF2264 domain-containing protein [Segetibacter sp. 3557_3]